MNLKLIEKSKTKRKFTTTNDSMKMHHEKAKLTT